MPARVIRRRAVGNLDGDGTIDLSDLATLLANYGETGVTYPDGDLDLDGDVDLADLAGLLAGYSAADVVRSAGSRGGERRKVTVPRCREVGDPNHKRQAERVLRFFCEQFFPGGIHNVGRPAGALPGSPCFSLAPRFMARISEK